MPLERPAIVRTERGLTLAGSRVTLYDILDYLEDGRSPEQIRDLLLLSDGDMHTALAYIAAHGEQVDAEYRELTRESEEIRQYWEDRNRKRLAQIAAMPKPELHALRTRLEARKAQRAATE